jgi:hypothetical protein
MGSPDAYTAVASRDEALAAWRVIGAALRASGSKADRQLADSINEFVAGISEQRGREATLDPGQNPARALSDRMR